LYTPGTIINHSDVLAPRLAQPTAVINPADANPSIAAGDMVQVMVGETAVTAQAHLSDKAPAGLVLLRGVPYFAGTAVAQISKLETEEELA
jgi:anaerobic selenocysteine-containing dehydrogenase